MNTINTLNGVILASRDEVTEHAENPTVHLTEEERIAWNAKADAAHLDAKADAATFTAHENNQTVHVSEEEKEKWNARNTKGILVPPQDALDDHTENTTVHLTEEERTAWNAKAEGGRYFERTLTELAPLLPEGELFRNGDCFFVTLQPGSWEYIRLNTLFEGLYNTQNNGVIFHVVFYNNSGMSLTICGGAGDVEAPIINDSFPEIYYNYFQVVTAVVAKGGIYCDVSANLSH